MRKPQYRFEHAHQRPARAALLFIRAARELYLGELEVPVAVLVPDEFIDRSRGEVEAVLVEAFRHFGFRSLQLADDPAIDEGQRY